MNIKLGNIILSEEQTDKKEDIINYYKNYNEIKDNSLPTLIVGWNLTKTLFEDDNEISILNKKIKDNLFWTFNKKEKQIDYDHDLIKFIDKLPYDHIKHLKYRPFDILINKLYSIEEIISYIFYSSTGEKRKITSYYCYSKDNVYFSYVNTIIGFTLESVDFLQINKEKLLNEIKNNSQLFITEEENKEIIDSFKKYFDKLDNFSMCVPFLVNKFQK